ncbi:ATP-binding cassette domain-containing protein, partial [Pseudomonas fulva]|uniref:ATP-binding cassette domain-containing protein n=1 Tax=Pseudomonas fulva TaxID=47880 RepID=UPI003D043129
MAQYVYTMHRLSKVVPPKREILKNISLSFFPGAKIGVLGLNGAGKSTLLRIMAGQYLDQNNSKKIDGWERYDLGARYAFKLDDTQ